MAYPVVGGLYIIRMPLGHFYGGRSGNIRRRIGIHLKALKRGVHGNTYMQRVYVLHQVFEFEILEEHDSLAGQIQAEQAWLDANLLLPGCMNLSPLAQGGSGGRNKGWEPSEETRERMRAAALGRKHSPETRAAMSAAKKGAKFTPEHVANMGKAWTGRKHTQESIEKMRMAHMKSEPEGNL